MSHKTLRPHSTILPVSWVASRTYLSLLRVIVTPGGQSGAAVSRGSVPGDQMGSTR